MVDWATVPARPLVPDYAGACLTNLVPALLGPAGTGELPAWFPTPVKGAGQVVLLVLDGLGWDQLGERATLAPTMSSMAGGPIDAVAPTTTATALTSIVTGLTPGEHGVVGYRMAMHGEVLNVLRWNTSAGDARRRLVPTEVQPRRPFLGSSVPVVAKTEFVGSGFTEAHLAGVRHVGWRMPSNLAVEVGRLLAAGEPFVYGYYDGIDKVAHEYGLGRHYDAELAAVDRLVADVAAVLPSDAALVVTADHGQVDVPEILPLAPDAVGLCRLLSGEGRFRWLHARPGAERSVLAAATRGPFRAGLGRHRGRGGRRRLARSDGQRRRSLSAGRRGRGGAGPRQLRRPGRHRRHRVAVPARFTDLRRGPGSAARHPWGMIRPNE